MGTKREFAAAVKEHFLVLTPRLDVALATIGSATYLRATVFLHFEYDSPHFSDTFAVSAWPMSRKGKPTGERLELLPGKTVVVPSKIYDAPKFEDVGPWHTASGLLERWFVTRWRRLLRKNAPLPAFIGHHDSYFKTDLETGDRTNWDAILKSVSRG